MKNKDLEKQFRSDAAKIQVPNVLEEIKNADFNKFKDLPSNSFKVEEAAQTIKPKQGPKRYFKWVSVVAASLAIIVFGAIYLPGLFSNNPGGGDDIAGGDPPVVDPVPSPDPDPILDSWLVIGNKNVNSFNVSVFVYNESDTFVKLMKNELLKQFTNSNDIYIEAFNASGNQSLQNKQLDSQIESGTDLLVVNIVDILAEALVIDKAKNADIPVIFFQKPIHENILNSYDKACFVTFNNIQAGIAQGELIFCSLLKDWDGSKYKTIDKNKDGNISYAMFRGESGNPEANARTKDSVSRCNELLAANNMGQLVQVGNDYVCKNWSGNDAFLAFSPLLHNNIFPEIIICNNDNIALGIIDAYESYYETSNQESEYFPIFGIDGNDFAITAIESGKMEGTVIFKPEDIATALTAIIINVSNSKDFLENTSYSFISSSKTTYIGFVLYLNPNK